jgi:hypothetical protein
MSASKIYREDEVDALDKKTKEKYISPILNS